MARKVLLRTSAAKRAFEWADHRLLRGGRQITIAAFTIGSECQHIRSPMREKSAPVSY